MVKDALIEILAESKNGMSLAQLPLYLRKKLTFTLDLNELGFPKLKDLILSMNDEIKLELRGINHPFAYLITSGNRPVHSKINSDDFQSQPQKKIIKKQGNTLSEDIDANRHLNNALVLNENKFKQILLAFDSLFKQFPFGMYMNNLPSMLFEKLGFEFNEREFGCSSLYEFLHKYVNPTSNLEFITQPSSKETLYLIRSKNVLS
mmetsp:Transcript_46072/g.33846  ORF Transcript_46072/g.33846 Transcript_46072/m.33846 type:complete len:205 (+) Transcript_46072:1894-2508(+)